MNRRLVYAAAGMAALLVVIWGTSAYKEAKHKTRATQLEQQAAQAKGEALAKTQEAARATAEAGQAKIQEALAETAKQRADAIALSAKREAAALRAGLMQHPRPPFSSATGKDSLPVAPQQPGAAAAVAEPLEGVSQLRAFIEKQDEVIDAQDAQIKARDAQISAQALQIGALERSNQALIEANWAFQKQARAQELATAEWRKAVGNGERRAGIKWGVVGFGLGAVGGFFVGRK